MAVKRVAVDVFDSKKRVAGFREATRSELTEVREVVDEENLADEVVGRAVEDAVDGAEEDGPRLVVEDDHDARVRQQLAVPLRTAPGDQRRNYAVTPGGTAPANYRWNWVMTPGDQMWN